MSGPRTDLPSSESADADTRPTAGASPVPHPSAGSTSAPARSFLTQWSADLGWRMALVVVAAVLAGIGAPTPIATVLTATAVLVTIERLVRHRGRGMLDAALVGAGGLVTVLGLLGLAVNYLPGGITRTSWSVGLVLIGIGGLTAAGIAREDAPASPFRPLLSRTSLPVALWSVAAVAVLTAALVPIRSILRPHARRAR